MPMKMKIGDRVEVVDDTITGVITAIQNHQVTIETDDGFPMQFQEVELILEQGFSITRAALQQAIQQKSKPVKRPKPRSAKHMQNTVVEVDLHIENLTKSTRFMSDYDMLNLQLNTAKNKLDWAIQNHIRRLVFIHGVGRGVLRMELETLLSRYDEVKFYDADYSQYGRGATEVYIYQNL